MRSQTALLTEAEAIAARAWTEPRPSLYVPWPLLVGAFVGLVLLEEVLKRWALKPASA